MDGNPAGNLIHCPRPRRTPPKHTPTPTTKTPTPNHSPDNDETWPAVKEERALPEEVPCIYYRGEKKRRKLYTITTGRHGEEKKKPP